MTGEIVILGCGGSAGVPAIGNDWGACDPANPKNRRTRPSIAVFGAGGACAVIDTGPDFKEQVNREHITRLDAVLYSHAHSDHVLGIDEMRIWARRAKGMLPVRGTRETLSEITRRFDYLFEQISPLYPPFLRPEPWGEDDFGADLDAGGISYRIFRQQHGDVTSVGFRFGNVGYSTDMMDLDDAGISALRGIDTWIVDGNSVGFTEALAHANLPRILALNEKIGAGQVYLTHLTIRQDYDRLCADLPAHIRPAHDGMRLRF